MGTRSTVKFYEGDKNILSVYQQYDGYVEGVGAQIAELFKKYKIVNGIPFGTDENLANGISELALYYVMDSKTGKGNIYATHEGDSQEYNYEIRAKYGTLNKDDIKIKVTEEYDGVIFKGTATEFIDFVEK